MTKASSIGAIILAAGAAQRMGRPKQVLPYQHMTLVEHVTAQALAAGFNPVGVVTGAYHEEVARVLPGTVHTLYNPDWQEGMGTSLAYGIKHLQAIARRTVQGSLAAIMVMLADQPRVDATLLQQYLHTFQSNDCDAVALQYPSGPGVPALFSASLFDVLQNTDGQQGAKAILRSPKYKVLTLAQLEAYWDIDTPEDYQQLTTQR